MSESKDFKVMGRCIQQEDEHKIKDGSVEVDRTKRTGRRPGRRPIKVDQKIKLERSRQSARECRARKKLRYQYLEDLVKNREQAIFALKDELELYKRLCKEVDFGKVTDELKQVLEDSRHKYGQSKLHMAGDTDSSSSPAISSSSPAISSSSPAISSSSVSQGFGSSEHMMTDDSNSTEDLDREDEQSSSLPNSLQGSMNELNEIRNEQVPRHNKVAGLLSMPKKMFGMHQNSVTSNRKILENDDILKDIKLRSAKSIETQSNSVTGERNCTYPSQESSTYTGKLFPEKRLSNLRELLTCQSEPMEVKIPNMQHNVMSTCSNGTGNSKSAIGTYNLYSSISPNQKSTLTETIDLSSRLHNSSAQMMVTSPNSGTKPQDSSFQNIVINRPRINNFSVNQRFPTLSGPHGNIQQQIQLKQEQQHSRASNFNSAMMLPTRIDFSECSNTNYVQARNGGTNPSFPSSVRTFEKPVSQPSCNFFKTNERTVTEKDNIRNNSGNFSIDFMDMDIDQLKSVYIDSCDDVKNDPINFDIGCSSSKISVNEARSGDRLDDSSNNRTRYQFGKRRSQSDPVAEISEGQFDASSQSWDFLDDMMLKN
ncbi:hypothetical protein FSP39_024943 [Pinctada imbricata]|uniref:BZIP domain-containing protein n=1 Tax=Pinctada imbricata TaxID=66713 RepID=A0AA88XNV0_PINIB|nr:hypothetical protein FSP39_024943 [Pinctada imbricata]